MAVALGGSRIILPLVVLFIIAVNLYMVRRAGVRFNLTDEELESCIHDSSHPTSSVQPTVEMEMTPVDPVTVTLISTVTSTITATAVPDNSLSTSTTTSTSTSTSKPSSTSFPSKFWQKCGHKGVSDEARGFMEGCLEQNPYMRHEVLTDESADEYVREHYSDWPEVLETYKALTVPILKADFLRMLILYADGGVWNDLDVKCLVPISEWIPKHMLADQEAHPINVIVGVEFDAWQFTSWTVMAKPHLQHFKHAIEHIIKQLHNVAEKNQVTLSEITKPMCEDVVAVTGPQAMTVALLQSVSIQEKHDFMHSDLGGLKEPKLIGDILVHPQAAFAALQGRLPKDQGPYLVEHHYFGSWKNDAGSEEGQEQPSS